MLMHDNRNQERPIPDNFVEYLTDEQKDTLNRVSRFGWRLQFIRRPLFEEPTVVLSRLGGRILSVLEKDGHINTEPVVQWRH